MKMVICLSPSGGEEAFFLGLILLNASKALLTAQSLPCGQASGSYGEESVVLTGPVLPLPEDGLLPQQRPRSLRSPLFAAHPRLIPIV